MPFHVHRAERADTLVVGLADVLAKPAGDPFDEELVIVPARGVERWLGQQLGHRLGVSAGREDGVCAGVRFTSPRSLMAELLGTKDDDPWDPDRLVWPLLDVIDASLGEPWCRTLARHLGEEHTGVERELRRSRRYGVARRIAGLFGSYASQRPWMLGEWAAGSLSTGTRAEGDLAWQGEIYRRLLERVDAPAPDVRLAPPISGSRRAQLVRAALADLVSWVHAACDCRRPAAGCLAAHRDVHLWLPHPSPALWDALQPLATVGPVRRADDPAPIDAPNPLLISLGRDSRELQRMLHLAENVHDEHLDATDERPDTLLGWLQDDLVNNRGGADGRTRTERDRSIQVHACHGKARQVDVLREVLVGLLEDDPTLEPRDILVMCPDIETYAPLIHAAFGLSGVIDDGHPAHQLRVRLADRGSASTNPLLQVATTLVTLAASGRMTATEVLDLIAMAPVRHRFGLSDDDLEKIARWVDRSGVRWGFDAVHREQFDLGDLLPNTWEFGLDRVLVGAAVAEQRGRWIETVLPLDDVSSGDIDLAGRLAELVDRLRGTIDAMTLEQPVSGWVRRCARASSAWRRSPYRDEWQIDQLERELARLDDAAHGSATPLRLAEISDLLGDRLGSRPTRSNFRTGTLTVCTMVPMRSVPHRVICMLGMDDGEFPRVGAVHGDDVLARDPMTGERDVRSEDRQLFLDAIMAATETLVLTYTGADERTGAVSPARRPARRAHRPGRAAPPRAPTSSPPPAAAVRPAQRRARRARPRPAVHLRPRRPRRCAGLRPAGRHRASRRSSTGRSTPSPPTR